MVSLTSHAINLGVFGNTYKIKEEDLLQAIERKSKQFDSQKMMETFKEKVKTETGRVDYSFPIAVDNASFLIDLTYTLEQDIPMIDKSGNITGILYPKGFTFNPLDYVNFRDILIFINGTRDSEINFVKEKYADDPRAIIVITKGNAFEVSEKIKRKVYIYSDRVASRFHISKTPSVVYQSGNMLKVDEIALGDKK